MRKGRWIAVRLLGVGLAAVLAVVTLSLAVTGQIGLYINPDSAWFAVGMSVVLLIGAALTFTLPLGAEADDGHGHDHGHAHDDHEHEGEVRGASIAGIAAVAGGVLSTALVATMLVVPPTALSTQLALERGANAPPLFGGADRVALATTGDTAAFGVGDWASVFASATDPDQFVGKAVTLTGFVGPSKQSGGFGLTRLVITHCVVDAQAASVPIATDDLGLPAGQWVTVTGTIRADADGRLRVDAAQVATIAAPKDPYEY
ncbi:TIGR03943 family protein [Microbacterium sp. X-17]|uniref:TIGR03943 family putative permease subunit n=1 Tax=Microbacterium sp. X-17 TaxID=3144404 RepID=UPI0031F4EFB7